MRDAVATMGTILSDDVGGRDAVHVAVIAVQAGEKLAPSSDVSLSDGSAYSTGDHVGIVDPFLTTLVMPGQRFWLYLYPRTITGLRHSWTHPAFPDENIAPATTDKIDAAQKAASEQWLRNFVFNSDCPGYHDVMAAAEQVADGNNPAWDSSYLYFSGEDAHGEIPSEFWDHVSIVLGKEIKGPKPTHFSCSC
jgi:hypothetical protein